MAFDMPNGFDLMNRALEMNATPTLRNNGVTVASATPVAPRQIPPAPLVEFVPQPARRVTFNLPKGPPDSGINEATFVQTPLEESVRLPASTAPKFATTRNEDNGFDDMFPGTRPQQDPYGLPPTTSQRHSYYAQQRLPQTPYQQSQFKPQTQTQTQPTPQLQPQAKQDLVVSQKTLQDDDYAVSLQRLDGADQSLATSPSAKPIEKGSFLPQWATEKYLGVPLWVIIAVGALSLALAGISIWWSRRHKAQIADKHRQQQQQAQSASAHDTTKFELDPQFAKNTMQVNTVPLQTSANKAASQMRTNAPVLPRAPPMTSSSPLKKATVEIPTFVDAEPSKVNDERVIPDGSFTVSHVPSSPTVEQVRAKTTFAERPTMIPSSPAVAPPSYDPATNAFTYST